MILCPNCHIDFEIENGFPKCNACGVTGEIDSYNGNLRFMLEGKLISAPDDERLAYDIAKESYPEIYENFEKE